MRMAIEQDIKVLYSITVETANRGEFFERRQNENRRVHFIVFGLQELPEPAASQRVD